MKYNYKEMKSITYGLKSTAPHKLNFKEQEVFFP